MKNKGFVHILVLILVVLGIGLLGYFSLTGLIRINPTKPTNIPISVDNFDTWQTLQTETFSIKYPPDWQEPTKNIQSTRVEYLFESNNLSVTEGFYFDQELGRRRTFYEEFADQEKSAIGKKEIIVGNKSFIKLIHKIGDSTYEETVILVSTNGNIIWITMVFPPDTDNGMFDQILSTFKYKNQSDSSWKTHKDTIYGFEFLYPSTWEDFGGGDSSGYFKTNSNNAIDLSVITDLSKNLSEYLQKKDLNSVYQVQNTTTININGFSAIQRNEYYRATDTTSIVTYFKNKNIIVSLTLSPKPGNSYDKDKSDYDQLLSTFKFKNNTLNQNIPKNWETRIDDKGWQISYPPTAEIKQESGLGTTINVTNENNWIQVYIFSDYSGLACANALCNEKKYIKVNIGGNSTEVIQKWPYTKNDYTFNTSLSYPENTEFSKKYGTITIGARYSEETLLPIINQILSTFKFTE